MHIVREMERESSAERGERRGGEGERGSEKVSLGWVGENGLRLGERREGERG